MRPRVRSIWLWLTTAAFFVAVGRSETLENVEKSAGAWVKMRTETARLETSWQEERALLESMIAMLQERATAAEEKRGLARSKSAQESEEYEGLRTKLQAEGDELKAGEERLKTLSARLAALRPNLPPRLSDALEMSFRTLSRGDLSVGERIQVVMTILGRCAQFNRTITLSEDVVKGEGDSSAKSLPVIYWGLSHGYALDRGAQLAWIGLPGPAGWHWEKQAEAFDSVARLMAVAGDKADPDFVAVPLFAVKNVGAEKGK